MRILSLFLVILVLVGCGQKSADTTKSVDTPKSGDLPKSGDIPKSGDLTKSGDSAFEKALVGAWDETRVNLKTGGVLRGRRTFIEGGRLNMSGVYTENSRDYNLIASGTWKVKDGHLHYVIETSNVQNAVPNGYSTADKIVKVTDSEFVYDDSRLRKTMVATRAK